MIIQDTELPQNTRISYFIPGSIKGNGKIIGISQSAIPFIGRIYIIEPDDNITSDNYPYTHFVCPEIYLEKLK